MFRLFNVVNRLLAVILGCLFIMGMGCDIQVVVYGPFIFHFWDLDRGVFYEGIYLLLLVLIRSFMIVYLISSCLKPM